jgi:hypothetical protein
MVFILAAYGVSKVKRGTFLGVWLAVGLVTGVLRGQDNSTGGKPHYRLLQVVEVSAVQDKLNENAADGYRFVGAAPTITGTWAAIMEKVETPAEPYRYLVLARKEQQNYQALINQAASQGFLLLSRSVVQGRANPPQFDLAWMEKPPGQPAATQYMLIGFGMKMSGRATMNPKLWADTNPLHYIRPQINEALEHGYQVERVVPASYVVMVKPSGVDESANVATDPSGKDPMSRYHTLGSYHAAKLQARLNQEATGGYRLIDLAPYAPPMWTGATLNKAGAGRCEYVAFESELLQLEQNLNAHAAAGFHLYPQSLLGFSEQRARPAEHALKLRVVMERDATSRTQYRVLTARRLAQLGADLEKADGDGFRALGIGSFDENLVVVLEKPVAETHR